MSYDVKDILIGTAVLGAVGYGGYMLLSPKKTTATPAGGTGTTPPAPAKNLTSPPPTGQQTQPVISVTPSPPPAPPALPAGLDPTKIPGWPTTTLNAWGIQDAQAAGAAKGVLDGARDGWAKAPSGTSQNAMAPTGLSPDITAAYVSTYNQGYLAGYSSASTGVTPDPAFASLYNAALSTIGAAPATSGMGYQSTGHIGYGHVGYGTVPGSGWGSWRHFVNHGRASGLYPAATRGTAPVAYDPSHRGSAPVAYDANYGHGSPPYQGRHAGQSTNQAGQAHANVSGPYHGDDNVHHGYFYR
jgi:hypothetical protein